MTYLTANRFALIERTLAERDRQILHLLAELRLASGEQLRRVFFVADGAGKTGAKIRSCQIALNNLTSLGLLTRLARRIGGKRGGSAGYVYALTGAGKKFVLRQRGGPAVRTRTSPEFAEQFALHTLACTEVYVRLVEGVRHGEAELIAYESEPACWRQRVGGFGRPITLRPDGFARIGIGEVERHWFIEVDRGTENQIAIARQGKAYLAYHQSGAEERVMPKVMWLTISSERADLMRKTLHRLGGASEELFEVGELDDAASLLIGGKQ